VSSLHSLLLASLLSPLCTILCATCTCAAGVCAAGFCAAGVSAAGVCAAGVCAADVCAAEICADVVGPSAALSVRSLMQPIHQHCGRPSTTAWNKIRAALRVPRAHPSSAGTGPPVSRLSRPPPPSWPRGPTLPTGLWCSVYPRASQTCGPPLPKQDPRVQPPGRREQRVLDGPCAGAPGASASGAFAGAVSAHIHCRRLRVHTTALLR